MEVGVGVRVTVGVKLNVGVGVRVRVGVLLGVPQARVAPDLDQLGGVVLALAGGVAHRLGPGGQVGLVGAVDIVAAAAGPIVQDGLPGSQARDGGQVVDGHEINQRCWHSTPR